MKPDQSNWFAVVTKPRQEQIALKNLQRQGYECFLPMAENPYQRRSKKQQRIIEPLFPRYLFLKAIAQHQNLAPVRSTKGVISMVRFGTELAAGSKRLAAVIGDDTIRFAAQVKGLELPGYEPRSLQTMALGLAVGTRGADHNRSGAYEVDFSELRQNEPLKDGIARALSLRVWHRKELLDMRNQIQTILAILDSQD